MEPDEGMSEPSPNHLALSAVEDALKNGWCCRGVAKDLDQEAVAAVSAPRDRLGRKDLRKQLGVGMPAQQDGRLSAHPPIGVITQSLKLKLAERGVIQSRLSGAEVVLLKLKQGNKLASWVEMVRLGRSSETE
jgi:hypothetical protein